MRIVTDAQIPFALECFGELGEVAALPAAALNAATLRDADALIVRSVTRVGEDLLAGTPVKFVGSATSGTDHVDLAYLATAGIAFADAAGANANAVAEYIVAALLRLHLGRNIPIADRTLGIVGFGHVGRRVARDAAALGMKIVVNDPPLARATGNTTYRPLDEVLACDFVTLHVPLETGGPDPTYHLANAEFLAALRPGAVLINASRGAVVDSTALGAALRAGRLGACVLDVWEREPNIDADLLERCTMGTAHIAGHTLDAKRNAVVMLRDALAARWGVTLSQPREGTLARTAAHVEIESGTAFYEALDAAVRASFEIDAEDARLRAVMRGAPESRGPGFDALRSGRPTRREFFTVEVAIEDGHPAAATLRELGFNVKAPAGASTGTGGGL